MIVTKVKMIVTKVKNKIMYFYELYLYFIKFIKLTGFSHENTLSQFIFYIITKKGKK